VTALVAILLAPFAILTAFFAVEILIGLRPVRGGTARSSKASAVVVVPAHDEAEVVGKTLQMLKAALGDGMRVLVVADNCTDATAEIARAQGVEVIERTNAQDRGKGFALALAAEHLSATAPDVFVVLDADCSTDAVSLRNLIDAAATSGRPSQAINLLQPNRRSSPLVQLSTFGFMLKNLVRQRGLQRLAGRVHLTGTGMAMPFDQFRASAGTKSSIVEDLALGLELAAAGNPPMLVSNALVWSESSTEQGTLVQRRRWEGGFLSTALRWGFREAAAGIAAGKPRAILAGLDLMVPPLALFAVLNVLALIMAGVLTVALGAAWWPVVVQFGLLLFALFAVFAAWMREGRRFISLGVLARLPLYVLWKLPMYVGLARGGAPKEWLRTGR
jgi:cellulose synthase/poly-beta-1,6-N-acetylglucosamine synthase-like glycosyltransferase